MVKEVHSSVDTGALRSRSAQWLGFAGLIPFWMLPIIQFGEAGLGTEWKHAAETAILLYGVTIVSFMGGGRWVFRIFDVDDSPTSLFGGFLAAVMPPLVAWAVAAAPDILWGREFGPLPRCLIVAFLLLYQLGQDWAHRRVIPAWYMELRIMLTIGATAPIFFALVLAPMV
ncbi:DUF3429 domain-containing protein [Parvularcula lutaonensis]|uniref:DUF3429 domain-containing protein n=1 Tax=Parvularcula lutaonensis TaxID=491923 RepID=A0ABV7MA71_9PROT|nr:DUF3429 domain-containing protein [Parvularcula lutaonensis]GGY45145.1 hypothetical protein GCM10007148_12640 [Parvularcula lutaonensis]